MPPRTTILPTAADEAATNATVTAIVSKAIETWERQGVDREQIDRFVRDFNRWRAGQVYPDRLALRTLRPNRTTKDKITEFKKREAERLAEANRRRWGQIVNLVKRAEKPVPGGGRRIFMMLRNVAGGPEPGGPVRRRPGRVAGKLVPPVRVPNRRMSFARRVGPTMIKAPALGKLVRGYKPRRRR